MFEFGLPILLLTAGAWLLSRRADDPNYSVAMALYGLLLGVAVGITLQASAVTGDFSSPYLGGSDGEGYFVQAHLLAQAGILDFQTLIRSNYLGYQIVLAAMFALFSPSLLVGLLTNAAMILGALACVQRATFVLTRDNRAAFFAVIACMLTTAHVYYALVLLKEPALLLALALVLLSLSKIYQDGRFGTRPLIYAAIALAIIISMRATLLLFLALLMVLVGRQLAQKRASGVAILVGLAIIAAPLAANFSVYTLDSAFVLESITANSVVLDRFSEGDLELGGIAGSAGTFFLAQPFYLKLLLFLVPTGVQALLPFDVWNTQFLTDYAPSFFYRNLNILWLGIVFPWLLYTLLSLRRIEAPLISRFFIAGIAYFVFIAIIYGGLIPRYASTALVFVYPGIGYWWAQRGSSATVRSTTGQFFLLYYVVALVAVIGYAALRLLRG
ncbi:MAG: hypothetical protein ACEQR8_03785 [Cypionkella sp.]